MKPYAERRAWILSYLAPLSPREGVDVLNQDFVIAYCEATGVACGWQFFGAPKCPQLGQDLSAMKNGGYLSRTTAGIGDGLSGQGFPKWVWHYRLSSRYRYILEQQEPEPCQSSPN